jgi:hypothetical protein
MQLEFDGVEKRHAIGVEVLQNAAVGEFDWKHLTDCGVEQCTACAERQTVSRVAAFAVACTCSSGCGASTRGCRHLPLQQHKKCGVNRFWLRFEIDKNRCSYTAHQLICVAHVIALEFVEPNSFCAQPSSCRPHCRSASMIVRVLSLLLVALVLVSAENEIANECSGTSLTAPLLLFSQPL